MNRVVIHGMSYEREVSGKYSQWPGWHAFQNAFADPWGDRQTYWENVAQMSGYISRTQAVLQGGRPQIDLAVYKGQRAYGYGYTRLLDFGYSYDIISNPHLFLRETVVKDGLLCPDGPAYKTLLVVDQEMLPADSAKKLKEFAEQGLPMLFVGKLPRMASGAFTADTGTVNAVAEMLELPNVRHAANLDEAVAVLKANGIVARAAYEDVKLESICRKDESGTYYFLFNNGAAGQAEITLSGAGTPALVDAWTGCVTPVAYESTSGGAKISLELAAKDAKIIALLPETGTPLRKTPLNPVTLTAFDTTIESWGPDPDAPIPTQSKKTSIAFGLQPVGRWNDLPASPEQLSAMGVDEMGHVSGRGIYRTTFNLPDCDGAVLTVQTGDCMVVAGTINSHPLPAVNQRSGQVELSGLIHGGENTLELVIATTLINRLRISHPLFDGKGGMPAPPTADTSGADGAPPMMGNLEDDDYELPGAPMDMPSPGGSAYAYGLYAASVTPYLTK